MIPGEIHKIAVIGAGTMGQGIAQLFAAAGFETLLYDVSAPALQNGYSAITKGIQSAVEKGKLSKEYAATVHTKLKATNVFEELRADLIIEAAVEKLDVKQDIFRRAESINDSHSILATNTSSLSISQIATVLVDPSRFIGVHFFNPAPIMKLVEVVNGAKTDAKIGDIVREVLHAAGKISVTSTDSPGFIVNRVARHFYLESLRMLEDEVASAASIDALMRSAGFRMGPFELMDLIGIDINYAVSKSVYEAFSSEQRFKPSPLQQEKVAENKLGKKTGEGFYKYNSDGKPIQ